MPVYLLSDEQRSAGLTLNVIQFPSDGCVCGGTGKAEPRTTEKAESSSGRLTQTDCLRLLCGSLVILGQGCSDLVQMHVPQSRNELYFSNGIRGSDGGTLPHLDLIIIFLLRHFT